MEMGKRLLQRWSEKHAPQTQIKHFVEPELDEHGDELEETATIWLDLDSPECDVSRTELKAMLTDYWVTRKHHSTTGEALTEKAGIDEGKQALGSVASHEWSLVRQNQFLIRVTKDIDSVTSTHNQKGCCAIFGGGGDDDAQMDGTVPGWLSDIGKGYTPIEEDLRGPEAFWRTLGGKMQHVVMRALGKGITAGADNSSTADKLAQEALYAMKLWSIRSIGSPDGLTQPSPFSIGWDLMQVVLLLWVLTSVPFGIAFDIDVEPATMLWWWELWVDLYFVLDICLSFRTPYYFRGELHYSSKDMALHYMGSWFIPDVLSCASMIQYITMMTKDDDGSDANGEGTSTSRLAKLVRLTKLAKLLRLARMKRALSRLGDYAFERFGGNLMIALGAVGSVVKLISGFMLAMHLIACVWYMIGDMPGGWVPEVFPIDSDESTIMVRFFLFFCDLQ